MIYQNLKKSVYLLFLLTGLQNIDAKAQWGAPYTNSWINFGKPYVKIEVTQKGIHRVPLTSLPNGFSVNEPNKLQLWHRGKQVAILSTANNEIVFYGVPNNGALDSLLFRPMSSRMNPYTSIYSDQSAYFLTVGDTNGLRAEVNKEAVNNSLTILKDHEPVDVTAFSDEYSLSTRSAIRANFFNSFFENGASKTGVTILGGVLSSNTIQLTNLSGNSAVKPIIKLMVHGRNNNSRMVEIYIGKDEKSLRLVKSIQNQNFTASEYSFELQNGDVDANGKGILALKSVSSDALDRFSLAYYTATYPQIINMSGIKSSEFRFRPTTELKNRISISNFTPNAKIYDISDEDIPIILSENGTDFMVSRKNGKALKLLATNEVTTILASKITSSNFNFIDPKNYNYIIITSESLEAGALNYSNYRSSKEGGSYRSLVVKIKDIYDQFNFGEPSPVAVRRFVDYMLSDNNRNKYLFILGKSIAFNERMVRELPDEVPTIGFPGSDVLLVDGLAGVGKDIPAIPVGRLSALNNQQVTDYLNKVNEYEHDVSGNIGWRKNILHLNGGKTSGEITQLKNVLISLEPIVKNGFVGGKVTSFVKQQAIGEVETVNVTPEVNAGVGMITYFGHGSTTVTDLDMGYITDAARGYENGGKYPLMYFNGCGVGNVFSGRFNTSPSSSDRIALSLDWILAPKKGTVAIIANTFDTYVSTTTNYLEKLYPALYTDSSTFKLSIGKIQAEVARRIITSGADSYDIGNIHQALLQGDPALHMFNLINPDYAVDSDESILLYSESGNKTLEKSATIRAAIIMSNLGKYNVGEKVTIQVKNYYTDGTEEINSISVSGPAYKDTLFVPFPNKQNLSRIEVKIDPLNSLIELSETNNIAELIVDWDRAKTQMMYPTEKVKDLTPPILNVTFNDRIIKNEGIVSSNPRIVFTLTDDRILPADTSLLTVFIKSCRDNSCDYVKLPYSDKFLTLSQGSDTRLLKVNYSSSGLTSGVYQMLVTAKDKSGNSSINPYEVKFNIKEEDVSKNITVVCSPNPASSNYVRFETTGYDISSIQSIKLTIYNLNGIVISKQDIIPSNSGTTEWYWLPQSLNAGAYLYKVNFIEKDNIEQNITGKVQIVP